MTLEANTLLGNYRLLKLLGRGGSGEVYLAKDVLLGRLAAIKVLHPRAASSVAEGAVLNEARTIAGLEHPNIVRVLHVELSGQAWYMAMEYVDGGSIRQLVRRRGPMDLEEALTHSASACDALHYAHREGVIHRDVKPHNLLVSRSEVLKLADFGLAFAGDRSPGHGRRAGTPYFLAPEIWRGETPSPQTDLYGLGATLYYMLTGTRPFESSTREGLRDAHLHRELTFPPGLPESIVELLRSWMAKEPDARPRDAEAARVEAAEALSAISGRPTQSGSFHRQESQTTIPILSLRVAADSHAANAGLLLASAGAFAEVINQKTPAVVLHGPRVALHPPVLRAVLQGLTDQQLFLRLALRPVDQMLLDCLADRMDVVEPDAKARFQAIVAALRSGPTDDNVTQVVHLDFQRDPHESEIHQLVELVDALSGSGTRLIIAMEDAEPLLSGLRASGTLNDVATLSFPYTSAAEVRAYINAWTAVATRNGAQWSVDAIRLASTLDATGRARIDVVVHNATFIALGAGARIVTSWCVVGAATHAERIDAISELEPRFRARPNRWPDDRHLRLMREIWSVDSAD